jgi:hypothetical protein
MGTQRYVLTKAADAITILRLHTAKEYVISIR